MKAKTAESTLSPTHLCRLMPAWIVTLLCVPGLTLGQVIVGDVRVFETDSATQYFKNNQPFSKFMFEQVGTGKTALYNLTGQVNETLTKGTLASINILTEVVGPVTSTDPLTVLRQPVLITADATLSGFTGDGLAALDVGDVLEVSGYTNLRNSRRATGITLGDKTTTQWQLTGYARDIRPDAFSIGFQPVSLGNVVPESCPKQGLIEGQLVEVIATPKADILSDVILDTVTSVTCVDRQPVGGAQLIPASVEGFLRNDPETDGFKVGNTTIEISGSTLFINGDSGNFEAGVKLEAQGLFNTQTRVLAVTEVVFSEIRVLVTAPVRPEDVQTDGSIRIMGFDVRITDQTRDEDGISDIGLFDRTQVRVLGFVDDARVIYADRIRIAGAPDLGRTALRGPVSEIQGTDLTVLGVTIDTTDSTFIGPSGTGISSMKFFEQVGTGSQIEISLATLDETERTLTGGVVELEQINDRGILPRGNGFSEGAGLGTITVAEDLILDGAFEPDGKPPGSD